MGAQTAELERYCRFAECVGLRLEPFQRNARAVFDAAVPHAKVFRDFLEHLDEYLRDRGHRQLDGTVPLGQEMQVAHDRATGRVTLRFGDHELDLDEASEAALALAEVTAEVWFERTPSKSDPDEPDAAS
jgi:hypothetical protein